MQLVAAPALSTASKPDFILKKPPCAGTVRRLACLLLGFAASALPATSGASVRPLLQAFSTALPGVPPAPWRIVGLPNPQVPLTGLSLVQLPPTQDGPTVLQLRADKSYGNLSHALANVQPTPKTVLSWRWRLDQAVAGANLRTKLGDDAAVKVCALFDLPIERLGFLERSLMRLARSRTGEALPAATLCYVWDPGLPAGTLLPNAFTPRLRYLVVRGIGAPLYQWQHQQRNLHADFLLAFGLESTTVPALVAIVVGADADNTAGTSQAFVGDLELVEQ